MRVSGELDPIDRSFKFWKRVSLILGRFWSLSKQNEGSEFSVTGSATTTTLGTLSLPVFSFRRLCWPQRIHSALKRIETRSDFQQHDYFGPYVYKIIDFLVADSESLWLLLYNCLHYWNCLESHRIRIGPTQRSLLPFGFQSPRFVGRLCVPNFLWIQVMRSCVTLVLSLHFYISFAIMSLL